MLFKLIDKPRKFLGTEPATENVEGAARRLRSPERVRERIVSGDQPQPANQAGKQRYSINASEIVYPQRLSPAGNAVSEKPRWMSPR